jgi:hypothetical protein
MESKKAKFTQKTNNIFNVEEAPSAPRGGTFSSNFSEEYSVKKVPHLGAEGASFLLTLFYDTSPNLHIQSILRKYLRFV